MNTISRVKIKDFLMSNRGRFVSVTFVKKDGVIRVLNGRIARGDNKVTADPARPFICMLDINLGDKGEYRNVNLDTISVIKANRKVYEVR